MLAETMAEMRAIESKQAPLSSTTERIFFLDSLRAVAIIMVVGVHTLGYCVALPKDLNKIISLIVHPVSVPVFFLVDGYLFARSIIYSNSHSYRNYVRNSLFRLLAPWAIFTLIYTLARYAFEVTGFLKERLILGHPWQEVAISAYGSVYAQQLYFLFSLFLIRLCSPIIKKLFVMRNYFALLVLFFCYYAAYRSLIPSISPHLIIAGGQEPVLHALWGMQFYLVGIVLFKTSEIVNLERLFLPILLLFVLSLLIHDFGSYGFSLFQYLYLLTLFLFFASFKKGVPLLDVIGKNTMGIYLIHAPIVLKVVSLVLNKFVSDPMMSFGSVLFATFVLTICITLLINLVPYGCLLFGTHYKRILAQSSPVSI